MIGIKRAVDAVSEYSELHLAYRAAVHYGSGEHHRLRGDNTSALAELEQALATMKPGEHLLWANAATALVRTLLELGRIDDACRRGKDYLAQALSLGSMRNYLRAALGLALARNGEPESAIVMLDEALLELNGLGTASSARRRCSWYGPKASSGRPSAIPRHAWNQAFCHDGARAPQ